MKSIGIIGTVSNDRVKFLGKTREQPGGGALYSAVAASIFPYRVYLIAKIGKDFLYADKINELNLHTKYLKKGRGNTAEFHISYDERGRAQYDMVSPGISHLLKSKDIPDEYMDGWHIAPLPPSKQLEILKTVKRENNTVSVNIHTNYIKRNRSVIKRIMNLADIFIMNEEEALALTNSGRVDAAVDKIIPAKNTVIITLGSSGSIIIEKDDFTMAPSFKTKKIIDPTGSGDVYCGTLLPTFILSGSINRASVIASYIAAVKNEDENYQTLLKMRFRNHKDAMKHIFKSIAEISEQKLLDDYVKN